jgi:uncharacterized membrane protein YphA (DoxX/SURF4 family)
MTPSLARRVFAIACVAFGAINLVRLDLLPGLQPWPAGWPGSVVIATLSGFVFAACGVGLLSDGLARRAATALAVFFSAWVVAWHLPWLITHPTSGRAWVTAGETIGLMAATWILVSTLRPLPNAALVAARIVFGTCFLGFGVSHFVYRVYVESVIPAWIPGHTFWAYFTGMAHLSAGAALVTGMRARLAAALLSVMFSTWFLILHIPRAVGATAANEWNSLVIAFAFAGASAIVAQTLPRESIVRAANNRSLSIRHAGIEEPGAHR